MMMTLKAVCGTSVSLSVRYCNNFLIVARNIETTREFQHVWNKYTMEDVVMFIPQ